jgi:hypothetical protein
MRRFNDPSISPEQRQVVNSHHAVFSLPEDAKIRWPSVDVSCAVVPIFQLVLI